MPRPSKSVLRRGLEDIGKGEKQLKNRADSFNGRTYLIKAGIRRPMSNPDLFSAGKLQETLPEMPAKLTKLLLKVTIQRSLGDIQLVMSLESTVGDLIAATVRLYAQEGRRPLLPTTDPAGFDLHYSQFSLERLYREEKLKELGSRNFFLCLKSPDGAGVEASSSSSSSPLCSLYSNQADKVWFMDFSL
ncbi:hypothetical protein NE237_009488 [Protea cynaroides]|uniref:DUF7054 domain-containing protein n=1 Tax=Protea cynaroides TaxID=273540 RepID=A0A9Q0KXQ9_9MAGN|nr:hypothetical protein NE237_009488 [Protea cynaroides]